MGNLLHAAGALHRDAATASTAAVTAIDASTTSPPVGGMSWMTLFILVQLVTLAHMAWVHKHPPTLPTGRVLTLSSGMVHLELGVLAFVFGSGLASRALVVAFATFVAVLALKFVGLLIAVQAACDDAAARRCKRFPGVGRNSDGSYDSDDDDDPEWRAAMQQAKVDLALRRLLEWACGAEQHSRAR